MASTAAQRLGKLAQKQFDQWLAECEDDLAANVSREDERGWDLIVEFPFDPARRTGKTLDKKKPDLHCKIQVKGISAGKKSLSINLENWSRMVTDQSPWFVAVLVYNPNRRLADAYLIHIDEYWVAKTLERLRKIKQGQYRTLHKKSLSIRWKSTDRLAGSYHVTILSKLKSCIGDDMEGYAARKAKSNKELGFSARPYKGHVTFRNSGNLDAFYTVLARHAVGLEKDLPIEHIRFEEERFGIPVPYMDAKDVTLSLQDPVICETEVTISSPSLGKSITTICKSYSSAAVFDTILPAEYHLRRFQGKYFSLLFGPKGEHSISTSFPDGEPLDVIEFVNTGKVLKILHASENTGVVFEFKTSFSNSRTQEDTFKIVSIVGDDVIELFNLIDDFWFLVTHFDLDVKKKYYHQSIFRQKDAISSLSKMLKATESDLLVYRFFGTAIYLNTTAAYIIPFVVNLSNYLLIVIVALIGQPQLDETNETDTSDSMSPWVVKTARARIITKKIILLESEGKIDLAPYLDSAEDALHQEGILVLRSSIRESSSSSEETPIYREPSSRDGSCP